MQKGTPPIHLASTLVTPGALFEEDFRGNFTAGLWAYAREKGLLDLPSEYRKREGKEEYLLVVDELTMLGEWLPLPVPGQSQTEWICAFLLWCKSPIREKFAEDDIAEIAQNALFDAVKERIETLRSRLSGPPEDFPQPALFLWRGRDSAA